MKSTSKRSPGEPMKSEDAKRIYSDIIMHETCNYPIYYTEKKIKESMDYVGEMEQIEYLELLYSIAKRKDMYECKKLRKFIDDSKIMEIEMK